jgi:hypothetical protein
MVCIAGFRGNLSRGGGQHRFLSPILESRASGLLHHEYLLRIHEEAHRSVAA